MTLILSCDDQDLDIEPFNTEEEILDIILDRNCDQSVKSSNPPPVMYEYQQAIPVVWDEGEAKR